MDPQTCSTDTRTFAERRWTSHQELVHGPTKSKQPTSTVAMAYQCKVKYIFEDGHTVIGEGEGMAIGSNADDVIPIAKKIAVTQARKDAFSRLVIVIFNGKVGVRVLAESTGNKPTVTDAEIDYAPPGNPPIPVGRPS